jgi:hypothetical protein
LFVGSAWGLEAETASGWGGEADVCKEVDVVWGVVGGGAVGCVGEVEEGEGLEVGGGCGGYAGIFGRGTEVLETKTLTMDDGEEGRKEEEDGEELFHGGRW